MGATLRDQKEIGNMTLDTLCSPFGVACRLVAPSVVVLASVWCVNEPAPEPAIALCSALLMYFQATVPSRADSFQTVFFLLRPIAFLLSGFAVGLLFEIPLLMVLSLLNFQPLPHEPHNLLLGPGAGICIGLWLSATAYRPETSLGPKEILFAGGAYLLPCVPVAALAIALSDSESRFLASFAGALLIVLLGLSFSVVAADLKWTPQRWFASDLA